MILIVLVFILILIFVFIFVNTKNNYIGGMTPYDTVGDTLVFNSLAMNNNINYRQLYDHQPVIKYFYVSPIFIESTSALQTGYLFNCCAIFFTIEKNNYGCHCISTLHAEIAFKEDYFNTNIYRQKIDKIKQVDQIYIFYSAFMPSEEFKYFCSLQKIAIICAKVGRNDLITYNNQNYEITIGELPYVRIDDTQYLKYDISTGIQYGINYIKDNNNNFILEN
jgi:hypothetical protein